MTRLDRYSGGIAASVALAAVGVLANADALVVSATIPLGYVVYGSLTRVPVEPGDLTVERSIDRTDAYPGDRVGVELTVTNDGDGPIPDLRVVDDVPDALAVVEGSPRGAFALRPGESGTVEYAVVANRGDHPFGPARLRSRSLGGTAVETLEVEPEGEGNVACNPFVDDVPLGVQTTQFAGRVRTDSGGSGVEFYSTREYHHGDPVSRIDWRRLARGQEMTTIEFREHRAARVVLVVDARSVCHVAPRAGIPTGAAMSAFGANKAMTALLSDGHEVGLAAFGVQDPAAIGPAWVEPGRGEDLEVRIQSILESAATGPDDVGAEVVGPTVRTTDGEWKSDATGDGPTTGRTDGERPGTASDGTPAPDGGFDSVEILRERLPPDAQVLFFTPAVDTFPRDVVRRLRAFGHGVTVVSPDVTHEDTPGGKLRTVERSLLIDELRDEGAMTIDWGRERPLSLVLTEALEEVVG